MNEEARALIDSAIGIGLGSTFTKRLKRASPATIERFLAELAFCDLEWVDGHRRALLSGGGIDLAAGHVEPVTPSVLADLDVPAMELAGRESIAAGEWAVVVFTGGSSTRFYSDGPRVRSLSARGGPPPKGMVAVMPVTGRSFLELFAAQTLAAGVRAGRMPFLLLMTSCLTDWAIRRFLRDRSLQGFPGQAMIVFRQAEHPRLDPDGDLIVRPGGRLAWTGDGHGGVFRAMLAARDNAPPVVSVLADCSVRHAVMHNVDNAAANALDPARIGAHVTSGRRLTLSAVARRSLREKVGLVMRDRATGQVRVVEYSVCPREIGEAIETSTREPLYRLAHINTNLVSVSAIRDDLPCTLYTGKNIAVGRKTIASSSYEVLNQHLSERLGPDDVGVLLLDRARFFLPTKTRTGEDSLIDTKAALARMASALLAEAGAMLEPDAVCEVDPCVGETAAVLIERGVGQGWRIGQGARVYLGARLGPGSAPFAPCLEVGPGATFWVEAERPYGTIDTPLPDRRVRVDEDRAGRVRVGRDVKVDPGADVRILVPGRGLARIPDGARLSGRKAVVVGEGEDILIE